jgi:DHA1 family bicyclomycin/chloramphenicol resistance-like MFS transporter
MQTRPVIRLSNDGRLNPGSRRFTLVLAALTALTSLSIDMNLPALPQLADAFHSPVAKVQLTLSLFLLGFAIGQLVCGPISDRVGRRPLLLSGLLLFAVAGLICALSPSLTVLIIARFVQGIGASVGPVLARAIVRDCYSQREASGVLSQITQVMIVAPLLAPMMGGYFLIWFGWPSIFLVLAASGTLLWIVCWRVLPETASSNNGTTVPSTPLLQDFGHVLSHTPTMRHVLTSCFAFAGMFAYISASPFVAIQIFHVAKQNFGYVFAVTAVALMIGATLNRKLVNRFAPPKLLQYGVMCIFIAGWLMVVFTWMHFGALAGIVGPMMLYMVGQGLVQPNAMASAMAPHGRMAGLASALTGGLQTVGGSLAGFLVGAFYNGTALPMACTVAIMGTLAFLIVDRRHSSQLPMMDEEQTDAELTLLESGA